MCNFGRQTPLISDLKKKTTMTIPKIALLFGTTELGHLGDLVIARLRPEAAQSR
jgi:hypothetical protein